MLPDTASIPVTGQEFNPETPEGLRSGLAGLRSQLAIAQGKDPRLSQIIATLRKQPKGTYLAEPHGSEGFKVKARALSYRLATDGLLVAKEESTHLPDRPVIPDTPYEAKGAPARMTWKHFVLGAMHNTVSGAHRRPEEMHEELKQLVCWWPPEGLLKACKEWRQRCNVCTSVHSHPTAEARFQAVKSCKPFYRVQIDFMEVKPQGEDGERYLLTLVCVATRYLFIRVTKTRDAEQTALLLFDIILDMGVVPAVCQSDNEFVNLAFEELCSLLGCTQLFSTALRPQSQGIVERSHRDLRASLAIVVETFIRACPRKWPKYVRYLEAKLRHKLLPTGDSPYSAIHGFKGSTALGSALGAIEEIPQDSVWSDWLDSLVGECKEISSRLVEHWAHDAEVRARKHSERKPEASFQEGELVLIQKAFFERGTGSILPQCDGPYSICRVPTAHTAVLEDPLTGDLFMQGKPQSVARLIKFHFPPNWAGPEPGDLPEEISNVKDLRKGDFVAVEPVLPWNKHKPLVYVARVERVHHNQELVSVTLFRVPDDSVFGHWNRRAWAPWYKDGEIQVHLLPYSEVLCRVTLQNGALTQESLEALGHLGVSVGVQPSRDKAMPSRY